MISMPPAKTGARGQTAALLASLWLAAASGLFAQPGAPAADPPTASAPVPEVKPAYVPLTEHDRLHLYLKRLVSPEAVFRSAAGAGFSQLTDTPKEWGQSAEGFGRRFGSEYAEHIVRETLLFGSSSVLDEDNHYIRSAETGFGKRLKYALESSVLARHDDGTRHLSISKIGSFLGASLISRMWQPPSENSLHNAGSNFGIGISVAAGFDVAREFLPDLLHRKRGLPPF